jgi:hypothetical protein
VHRLQRSVQLLPKPVMNRYGYRHPEDVSEHNMLAASLDPGWFMLVPASTLYPSTVGRWFHAEGCAAGHDERCNCDTKETKDADEE